MKKSKIEWTDVTWNPVTGCTKISEGCKNCYAEAMAKRLKAMGQPRYANGFQVTIHPEVLEKPFHWKNPRRIFVCSMGDLFHEDVPFYFIAAVFGVMAANPQHTFQVLTKRPKRMKEFFDAISKIGNKDPRIECAYELLVQEATHHPEGYRGPIHCKYGLNPEGPWPLPNVWIGVTAENQEMANSRLKILMEHIPAKVRFVSIEPMLGPIDLNSWEFIIDKTRNKLTIGRYLDWVIVGGESGPCARPMEPEWVRSVRDQCVKSNVPFFFKQWGGKNKRVSGKELDGKIWEEFPLYKINIELLS